MESDYDVNNSKTGGSQLHRNQADRAGGRTLFIVVTGGSGSGKSEYAENRVLEFNDPVRFYVATMQCYDAESEARVQRHRKLRAGKGFETIERQLDLKGLDLNEQMKCKPDEWINGIDPIELACTYCPHTVSPRVNSIPVRHASRCRTFRSVHRSAVY